MNQTLTELIPNEVYRLAYLGHNPKSNKKLYDTLIRCTAVCNKQYHFIGLYVIFTAYGWDDPIGVDSFCTSTMFTDESYELEHIGTYNPDDNNQFPEYRL